MADLGRKQRITNDAWLKAIESIEDAVSVQDIREISEKTIQAIREETEGKKAAYAWSAGKDSIVLANLCETAGVHDSLIGVTDLEYPAFAQWIEQNKPAGCEVINTKQDLTWLAKHPEMLFPQDSTTAAQWFHIVQHRAQRMYFKAHSLDILLLGRAGQMETMLARMPISTQIELASPDTAPWLTGRMSKFWHISITTISHSRPFTAGKTATCAVRTHGRHANGPEAKKTAGRKSMR